MTGNTYKQGGEVDYKDWIQNRAEDLALEQYDLDLYELQDSIRLTIYEQAMKDYSDHYASQIDAAYDRWKDKQMMEVKHD